VKAVVVVYVSLFDSVRPVLLVVVVVMMSRLSSVTVAFSTS